MHGSTSLAPTGVGKQKGGNKVCVQKAAVAFAWRKMAAVPGHLPGINFIEACAAAKEYKMCGGEIEIARGGNRPPQPAPTQALTVSRR